MSTTSPHFGVIVPAKPPAIAKSRLVRLGDGVRRGLASAFAADTVEAALGTDVVDVVLAVTDDRRLATELRALGAEVTPDGAAEDLNASLVLAAAELTRRRPALRPVALCADLPALRAAELGRALQATAELETAFVADSDRMGTTLLAAASAASFRPAFGVGSRAHHLAGGAKEIELDGLEGLRRDVDTPEHLAAALALGVGRHSAAVLARADLLGPTMSLMQATVSRFDDATRAGTVLRDDGVELSFDSDALAGTGLRMLRPGQRVRLDLDEDRIVRLQILTLT